MSYLKKYYKYKLKQLGGSLPSEPSEKLLFILTTCAQNRFFVEVKPFINLNKSFRNDDQLLAANSKSLGKTNLMGAAFTGDIERITKLLKYYNINNTDHLGYTPLITACENGKNDAVIFLLDRGANKNLNPIGFKKYSYEYYDYGMYTPFMIACEKCNVDVIERFINSGTSVNETTVYGSTALMYAVKGNNLDVIRFLIERGVNINVINQGNNTALMLAIQDNKMNIVELLLESGADVNSIPNELMHAISNNNIELVRLLVRYHINLNIQSFVGSPPGNAPALPILFTTLELAVKIGNIEMIELLLDNGVDANSYLNNIHEVIYSNDIELMRLFIRYHINLTQLHIALNHTDSEMIQLLTENGATVNIRY